MPDVAGVSQYSATCAPAACPESGQTPPTCGYSAGQCPLFATGTTYQYSNWGFALLGNLLVHKDPGKSKDWRTLNRSAVLAPLGMDGTWADPDTTSAHAATSYSSCVWNGHAVSGCKPNTVPLDEASSPAGGLWSTGPDMLRFLRFNMGVAQPDAASAARKELYGLRDDAHFSMQCRRRSSSVPEQAAGPGVGLGWQRSALNGDAMVYKGGDWDEFHAFIGYVGAKGVGVVVMTNSNPGTGGSAKALAEDLVSALEGP
jgi:CubicO group peptidase (beta-lactamase class C family)